MASYELGPDEPKGWSPFAVALIATLVLALGLGGAVFGIYVADVNKKAAAGPAPTLTPLPEIIVTPTPSPSPSPSPTPTPSPSPTEPVPTLPNLVGANFRDARATVRDLNLSWTLVFGATGDSPTVVATNPPAGTPLADGMTVTITVKGMAPLADIPSIAGIACDDARAKIIDAGLIPDFKSAARTGKVLPATITAGLRWNDKMPLTCSG
jgi:hypothetical protein